MTEILEAPVADLAATKGSVRKLRHVLRPDNGPVYDSLHGVAGLSHDQQITRLTEALGKVDSTYEERIKRAEEAKVSGRKALELAIAVVNHRQGNGGDGDLSDVETVKVEPKPVNFSKAEALVEQAEVAGWTAEAKRGAGKYHKIVKLRFTKDGQEITGSYDTHMGKDGSFLGGEHKRSDGKTVKVRLASEISKAFLQ